MIHADAARPDRGSIYGAAASAGESADFGRLVRFGPVSRVDPIPGCRGRRPQYELPSSPSP
ncbi:hypothetical protein AUR65_007085 [Haloferax marisrubri]|uniref:Uncharacterized protein n=1 Tax=Haloferax marisrubri TaxID=1544719 RepID=A0A2P4NT57_9EURY|nr:hypothetical protein AUR65_007085 [Haloferax marisrubri]